MAETVSFKLYSVYYKEFLIPTISFVYPIQAGCDFYYDLGILKDNFGDNISVENQNFVELTALYHIWKNYSPSENPYFGLCHYRRYLSKHFSWHKLYSVYYFKASNDIFDKILSKKVENIISEKLKNGYIILPMPKKIIRLKKWSVKQEYQKVHDKEGWEAMENAVKKLFPAYFPALEKFGSGNKISLYNIMIASWEFWDGYLSWLFPILFEVKKNYTISTDTSERRVFGFLSERLLNTYVLYQSENFNQKVYFMPVAHLS